MNERYRSLTIITSFGAIELGSVKYQLGESDVKFRNTNIYEIHNLVMLHTIAVSHDLLIVLVNFESDTAVAYHVG